MSSATLVIDDQQRIVQAVGDVFAEHGYDCATLPGRRVDEVLPPAAWRELEPHYLRTRSGERQSFDYWTLDGARAYWIQTSPLVLDSQRTWAMVVMNDITHRVLTMRELERSEERLKKSEEMVGLGTWELSVADLTVTYSEGFARLLGLAPGDTADLDTCLERAHPDDLSAIMEALRECQEHGTAAKQFRMVREDGEIRTLDVRAEVVSDGDGSSSHIHGAALDVTEHLAAEQGRRDALSLFEQGFDAAPIAIALSDPVNGRYVRVNDAACELLGRSREELLGLTPFDVTHPDDRAESERAWRDLHERKHSAVVTEKRYVRSDGSTLWASVYVTPVYAADGSIRAFFSHKLDLTERKAREAGLERAVGDAVWLGRIRDALDEDRFTLFAQPIVDLRTGAVVQRELLLRMRAEDGSIIAPGEFLPIAERYGLMSEIDRWVIRRAIALAADGTPTEFNISAASIGNPDIVRELSTAIAHKGVDPSLLVVELTETALLEQPEAAARFAEQVHELGCGLALDDFGTGFGSLSHLKHIPADHLKIDIEFVRHLRESSTDQRMVRGIVALASEFHQQTVAEGVEDETTLAMLREFGVDHAQGYLLGRPEPLDGSPAPPDRRTGTTDVPAADAEHDPVDTVKAMFDCVNRHDLEGASAIVHPSFVLRSVATGPQVGRKTPYRGIKGLRAYFRDASRTWSDLTLKPRNHWRTVDTVVTFGQAIATKNDRTDVTEILWVTRFCGDRIASIEVYRSPAAGPHPARNHRDPAEVFPG